MLDAITVIILLQGAMNIGNLQGRAVSFCCIPARVPVNQSQAHAHVIATHPPVIAGKRVDPEAIRRARIDPNREAAIYWRMTRTWREDLVTAHNAAQVIGDGA